MLLKVSLHCTPAPLQVLDLDTKPVIKPKYSSYLEVCITSSPRSKVKPSVIATWAASLSVRGWYMPGAFAVHDYLHFACLTASTLVLVTDTLSLPEESHSDSSLDTFEYNALGRSRRDNGQPFAAN